MNARNRLWLPGLALLLVSGCATPAARGPRLVSGLHPTEQWLVLRGGMHAPLELATQAEAAGDALLRSAAREVDPDDPALEHLEARMRATLQAAQGVGLAAPQVGILRRVILVQRLDLPEQPIRAYRNPSLTWRSPETELGWEGCLSVPGFRARVRRARAVEVEHALRDGSRVRERVEGFSARIFQHEVDHLDGVLYLDRREPGPLVPEAVYQRLKAEGALGDLAPSR
jgi:peptide deformylase